MLNRLASLAMSTSVLKALPGKLDIKIHSPSILYLTVCVDEQGSLCLPYLQTLKTGFLGLRAVYRYIIYIYILIMW